MQITRLWSYPVKSLGGMSHERSEYSAQGLQHDRRWVLLDEAGNRVSARECPTLLGLRAEADGATLTLADRDGAEIEVGEPEAGAEVVTTRMSRIDHLTLADPAASRWVSERIGRPLRLAWQAPAQTREIGDAHGGEPNELMALADAGPILVIAESSLADLRQWIDDPSSDWDDEERAALRFRPNVVIDGIRPYEEDDWQAIEIGGVTWRQGELCDRCSLTTIDLTELRTTKEPIRTLAQRRKWDSATWFGVRFIPELAAGASGTLAVGDRVRVSRSARSL